MGQWAVNELILITVNSATSGRAFLHVCLHAYIQMAELERLDSWKREVCSSAPGGDQECLIVRVDRLRWGCLRAPIFSLPLPST